MKLGKAMALVLGGAMVMGLGTSALAAEEARITGQVVNLRGFSNENK